MGHIAPQQQQDVEGCNMAEAMAAMGLAIIAMKRKNACTRRIAKFVLLTFQKSKLLAKRLSASSQLPNGVAPKTF
jgi:hypothetical protein